MDIEALNKHIRSRSVWDIVVNCKEKRPSAAIFPLYIENTCTAKRLTRAFFTIYPFQPAQCDAVMFGDEKQIDDASKYER